MNFKTSPRIKLCFLTTCAKFLELMPYSKIKITPETSSSSGFAETLDQNGCFQNGNQF